MAKGPTSLLIAINLTLVVALVFLTIQVTQLDQRLRTDHISQQGKVLDNDVISTDIDALKKALKEQKDTLSELSASLATLPLDLKEEIAKEFVPAPRVTMEHSAYKTETNAAAITVRANTRLINDWLGHNALFLDHTLKLGMTVDWNKTKLGFEVAEVTPQSPFAQMGIKPGDRITAIDGTTPPDGAALLRALVDPKTLSVSLARDDKKMTLDFIYSEGGGQDVTLDITRAQFDELLPKLLSTLKIAPAIKAGKIEGVRVVELEASNVFALMNLQAADVITRINDAPVSNKTLLEILKKSSAPLELIFLRGEQPHQVSVSFAD